MMVVVVVVGCCVWIEEMDGEKNLINFSSFSPLRSLWMAQAGVARSFVHISHRRNAKGKEFMCIFLLNTPPNERNYTRIDKFPRTHLNSPRAR
jgi:hypothetical protein